MRIGATSMKKVFNYFSDLIQRRFSKSIPTTEDSMRYTFFHSLIVKGGYRPEDIVLEQPYTNPKFKGNKLDLYAVSKNKTMSAAFEFKYHRGNAAGYTSKAGELFWDIAKLANFKAKSKFIVYLTDENMKKYLTNPRNKHDWFSLAVDNSVIIDNDYACKFPKSLTSWIDGDNYINKCRLRLCFQSVLPKSHCLKIYEIED